MPPMRLTWHTVIGRSSTAARMLIARDMKPVVEAVHPGNVDVLPIAIAELAATMAVAERAPAISTRSVAAASAATRWTTAPQRVAMGTSATRPPAAPVSIPAAVVVLPGNAGAHPIATPVPAAMMAVAERASAQPGRTAVTALLAPISIPTATAAIAVRCAIHLRHAVVATLPVHAAVRQTR